MVRRRSFEGVVSQQSRDCNLGSKDQHRAFEAKRQAHTVDVKLGNGIGGPGSGERDVDELWDRKAVRRGLSLHELHGLTAAKDVVVDIGAEGSI